MRLCASYLPWRDLAGCGDGAVPMPLRDLARGGEKQPVICHGGTSHSVRCRQMIDLKTMILSYAWVRNKLLRILTNKPKQEMIVSAMGGIKWVM